MLTFFTFFGYIFDLSSLIYVTSNKGHCQGPGTRAVASLSLPQGQASHFLPNLLFFFPFLPDFVVCTHLPRGKS